MHKHIKKWGQIFLKNKAIQQRIANEVNNSEYLNILEIGPGDGALTQYIDYSKREFVAVEIDKKLSAFLENRYPGMKIIQADFLELDFSFTDGKEGLLFGNIPYYITSPIIFKFIENRSFREAIFMVQKEFYESIDSPESSSRYSSFSVLLQSYLEIEKIMDVGRRNFFPIPKVDSVVVRFRRRESRLEGYLKEYSIFLKRSFFMPRKTLANNWRKFLNNDQIGEIFEENSLKPNVRPDEISPLGFEEIFLSHFGKKWLHNIV